MSTVAQKRHRDRSHSDLQLSLPVGFHALQGKTSRLSATMIVFTRGPRHEIHHQNHDQHKFYTLWPKASSSISTDFGSQFRESNGLQPVLEPELVGFGLHTGSTAISNTSLAMVNWPQVARTCILRAFDLQLSCCLPLVLHVCPFLFLFLWRCRFFPSTVRKGVNAPRGVP